MTETKLRTQRQRQIAWADAQDNETLLDLMTQPTVRMYFHRDPERDEVIVNPDGSVSYIARVVNINGVAWDIPAEEHVDVPMAVHDILVQSEDIKRRYAPKPINIVNVGML